jgi:CBS domain containing-hemolysin-like protein
VNTVSEIIKEWKYVQPINLEQKIDQEVLKTLREKGFSRVPVYFRNKNLIVGILIVKSLVGLSTD